MTSIVDGAECRFLKAKKTEKQQFTYYNTDSYVCIG